MYSADDNNQVNPNQENDIENQNKSVSLEKDLSICKIEVQQLKDSFLRLNADFDNYKKRVAKEKSEWIVTAQSNLILDLLPIIDDFDRAFSENKKSENKDLEVWLTGFELIHKSLGKFLEKHGLKEITNHLDFDPEFHEGIAQIDSAEHKTGQIVSIVQKGYMFKDQVLRPAKVMVAK